MYSKISNYYCITYTTELNNNLIDSNIIDLDKIYAVKCTSKRVISYLLTKLINSYVNEKQDLEIIHNPIDNSIIQGVINLNLGIGIFDEDILDKIFNTTVFINLEEAIRITNSDININKSKEQIGNFFNDAYGYFRAAKQFHDEWEGIYLKYINFSEVDLLTKDVCDIVFGIYENDLLQNQTVDKISRIKARFFGAVSAEGACNYINEILPNYDNIIYIKGRPGTCKSTIMKAIANKAQDYGFDINIYNCASDVSSVDMICIEDISTCIFDSTAPHEFFPVNDDDIIIDTYTELLPEGFDNEHADEINDIKTKYQEQIKLGIAQLANVKNAMDLSEDNIQIIDFDKIHEVYTSIIENR